MNIGFSVVKGILVVKVFVSDVDEGFNVDIIYVIEVDFESVKENLEINKLFGVIIIKESFIGLENEFFIFFVRVVDNGFLLKEFVVFVYVKIFLLEM